MKKILNKKVNDIHMMFGMQVHMNQVMLKK